MFLHLKSQVFNNTFIDTLIDIDRIDAIQIKKVFHEEKTIYKIVISLQGEMNGIEAHLTEESARNRLAYILELRGHSTQEATIISRDMTIQDKTQG